MRACRHWQLRHYISQPEPDVLYYASGRDVYYLNTTTKKRKHLATLPFEARCTAAGYGWICVGGEDDGHFAVIRLDGTGSARPVDVDAPLPLDYRQSHRGPPSTASVKVEKIGEEIVNSISIHRIQDEEAHLHDTVAVLTNNDKTVRIYSLMQNVETAVLDLPFPVNHASISPDGTSIIAVGDCAQAYFFTRIMQQDPPQIPKPHNRLNTSNVDWEPVSVVPLYVADGSSAVGYFTTAWSPNGNLVAVGSEGGFITVFDMELFKHSEDSEDAIVATIASSRPGVVLHTHPGAVRTMLFSPDPWDLLVWTEDQGRICIGDLRTGLKTRQVVELKPNDDGLQTIEIEDLPSDHQSSDRDQDFDFEEEFFRRHQQPPDNATAINFATEYIEARRRQRQQRQDNANSRFEYAYGRSLFQDDPRGLTAHEQQILESLRTTRQREEARAQGSIPRSVNYTSPNLFSNRSNAGTMDSSRPTSGFFGSGENEGDLHDLLPSLQSIHEYLDLRERRQQQQSTENANPSQYQPRRRISVVLGPQSSSSPAPSGPLIANGTTTGSSAPAQRNEDGRSGSPWRATGNSNYTNLAHGPLFDEALEEVAASEARRNRELEAELAAERARIRTIAGQRERLQRLRRENEDRLARLRRGNEPESGDNPTSRHGNWARRTNVQDAYENLLRGSALRPWVGSSFNRSLGVRTAGLAISRDGQTVWAACEEGIFEIRIKVKSRMMFPAIDMA